MSCIALDSTNPQAVISAVRLRMTWRNMVVRAGLTYDDGLYAWPAEAVAQLQAMGIKTVPTSAIGTGSKPKLYDVETGDLTPAQAAALCGADARAGQTPGVYVNRSNKPAVISDLAAEGLIPGGVPGKGFMLWVATLDGTFQDLDGSDLRTQPGVAAVQYVQADSPVHVTGQPPDLDVSVVTAAGEVWLGIAPALSLLLAEVQQAQSILSSVAAGLTAQGA